jgi:hypothetical protein
MSDLHERVQSAGFRLVELPRIHGRRYIIVDQRGLVLRGSDEEPLDAEDVRRFVARFDSPTWLP